MQPTAKGLIEFITNEYEFTKDREDLKILKDLIEKVSGEYYKFKEISPGQQMKIYDAAKEYRETCEDEEEKKALLKIMGLLPMAFASAASAYHKQRNGKKVVSAKPVQDYAYASKL